jgi:hypothetical protein
MRVKAVTGLDVGLTLGFHRGQPAQHAAAGRFAERFIQKSLGIFGGESSSVALHQQLSKVSDFIVSPDGVVQLKSNHFKIKKSPRFWYISRVKTR